MVFKTVSTYIKNSCSIDVNVMLLHIFGVPIFLRETSQCTRYVIIVYCLMFLCLFNIFYVSFEIFDLILIHDLNDFAANCCLTVNHIGGNIKLINILMRLKDVVSILEKMKEFPEHYAISKNQKKVLRASEFENKLIVIVYATMVLSNAIVGFIALIGNPSIGGRTFPYRANLPDFLPLNMKIMYWNFGITMIAIQLVALDCLNINLINQIRCLSKLLISNLDELTTENQQSDCPVERLVNCVKHHQIILQLRTEIENVFKFPILVQFSVSILIFGLTGFQAIVLTGSNNAFVIYCYCACILCQLFCYCWFANQVMEENKMVAIAGCNTSWYEFGQKYSKTLLILLVNAQRPVTFSVGGFFDLSLTTFTGILSKSYSFVAILRQVYSN